MAAFVFALDGLADVVEQAGALGDIGLEPDLRGKHRAELRNLDGMIEVVLGVGKLKMDGAEEVEDLGVEGGNLEAVHRVLADLGDMQVDLVPRAVDKLLDTGRVDAAVLDEALQGQLGDLAAHG